MTSDEAWAAIVSANQEKDLDDFKVFFLEYVRNNKELTFADLEKKFRDEGLGVYLIAMVFPPFTLTPEKRYPATKNNPQSPRGNGKEISRLFPTWLQKSSYSVFPHLITDIVPQRDKSQAPRKRTSNALVMRGFLWRILFPFVSIAAQKVTEAGNVINPPKVSDPTNI